MGAQLAALSGLFLAVLTLAWLSLWLVPGLFPDTRWPEALLAVLGAALALSALARQLPGQNLVLAGLFIALRFHFEEQPKLLPAEHADKE